MVSVQSLPVAERITAVPVRGCKSALQYSPVWSNQQLHRLVFGRAPCRSRPLSSVEGTGVQHCPFRCCRIARSRRAAPSVRATAASKAVEAPTTAAPNTPTSGAAALTYTSYEGNSFRVQFAKTGAIERVARGTCNILSHFSVARRQLVRQFPAMYNAAWNRPPAPLQASMCWWTPGWWES